MSKRSERWKTLERIAARKLGGERVQRWLDFGQTAPDVLVKDFGLIVDCKAHARFSHHALMENIQRKYCERNETPVLISKHSKQVGEYCTVPLDWLANLLDEVRAARMNNTTPGTAE